eukprot:PhM_4_TR2318/c0_g1_i1/m.45973
MPEQLLHHGPRSLVPHQATSDEVKHGRADVPLCPRRRQRRHERLLLRHAVHEARRDEGRAEVLRGVGHAAEQQLRHDDAEGPHVAGLGPHTAARLRGHVQRRADEAAARRRLAVLEHCQLRRRAEVGELAAPVDHDEHVVGFDVAVDYVVGVEVREALQDLAQVAPHSGLRQRAEAGEHIAETAAADVLRDDHDAVRGDTAPVVGHNVVVTQLRQKLHLAEHLLEAVLRLRAAGPRAAGQRLPHLLRDAHRLQGDQRVVVPCHAQPHVARRPGPQPAVAAVVVAPCEILDRVEAVHGGARVLHGARTSERRRPRGHAPGAAAEGVVHAPGAQAGAALHRARATAQRVAGLEVLLFCVHQTPHRLDALPHRRRGVLERTVFLHGDGVLWRRQRGGQHVPRGQGLQVAPPDTLTAVRARQVERRLLVLGGDAQPGDAQGVRHVLRLHHLGVVADKVAQHRGGAGEVPR